MLQQNKYRLLVINPGSTSTKIGIYDNERSVVERTIRHDREEINRFDKITDQYGFRKRVILEALDSEGINLSKLNAVIGRGGLLRPIEGGTYIVNEQMLTDLRNGYAGEHASNLGGIIAYEIASGLNIPAFIVDPVVVDEMEQIARLSGIPEIERKSIFHALNQKAVAHRVAKRLNRPYEDLRMVVTHMGGGITVGVHKNGRVIDVNNGLHGEGPFSPERAGTVPVGDLVNLCYSGRYYADEIMKKLVGQAGLVAYLGTNNAEKIEKMIMEGDETAKLVYQGMAYQIAKEIGAASTVLNGDVDAIVITGGLASSKYLIKLIMKRVEWIADVLVHPGENELQALAEGGLRVLRNEEQPKQYPNHDLFTCDDLK